MAIWVSRYSNKELTSGKGKYYPVGISLGAPKWPLGYKIEEQCYTLAPTGAMLSMPYEQYRAMYFGKLNGFGPDKVKYLVNRMRAAAEKQGKELVLLCFEDVRVEDQWCHRTLFAEWWKDLTGETIRELKDPSEPKQKKKEPEKEEFHQMSLFE